MRKIERNIEKYELRGLNAELRQKRQHGSSLRELAAFVNRRVLETALSETNASVVGDVDSIYEALRGDEVSVGRRAEVSSRLKTLGVPMDEVEDDFVSHQTVSDYLQECLDIETSRQSQLTVEEALKTIEWADARGMAVINRTLTRLYEAGEINTDDVDVMCALRVTCEECGETYRLHEFLQRGGCDCTEQSADDIADTAEPAVEK